jgi:hypothetical protein
VATYDTAQRNQPPLSKRGGLKQGSKLQLMGSSVKKNDRAHQPLAQTGKSTARSSDAGALTSSDAAPCRTAPYTRPACRTSDVRRSPEETQQSTLQPYSDVTDRQGRVGREALAGSAKAGSAARKGQETAAAEAARAEETRPAASPPKRSGLRASARSVAAVQNAQRPAAAGKLRLHLPFQPPTGAGAHPLFLQCRPTLFFQGLKLNRRFTCALCKAHEYPACQRGYILENLAVRYDDFSSLDASTGWVRS